MAIGQKKRDMLEKRSAKKLSELDTVLQVNGGIVHRYRHMKVNMSRPRKRREA